VVVLCAYAINGDKRLSGVISDGSRQCDCHDPLNTAGSRSFKYHPERAKCGGSMDSFTWLQDWYAKQCDGTWEHTYGIQIETLDNPGWSVKINLEKTRYSGISGVTIVEDHTGASDWIVCKIADDRFEGCGDPQKLLAIVQKFRKWIESF
jgi:hypothetical protein